MKDRKVQLAALAAVAILLYIVVGWLTPEETKIRRQIETAAEAFNNCRAGGCTSILDDKYRDETSHVDKNTLRLLLIKIFQLIQNKSGDLFKYPAHVDADSLQITVHDTDPKTANVTGTVTFSDIESPDEPIWTNHLSAVFSKATGEWRIVSSRFEAVEGRRPF